jgi:hypothetical protein
LSKPILWLIFSLEWLAMSAFVIANAPPFIEFQAVNLRNSHVPIISDHKFIKPSSSWFLHKSNQSEFSCLELFIVPFHFCLCCFSYEIY